MPHAARRREGLKEAGWACKVDKKYWWLNVGPFPLLADEPAAKAALRQMMGRLPRPAPEPEAQRPAKRPRAASDGEDRLALWALAGNHLAWPLLAACTPHAMAVLPWSVNLQV